MSTKKLLALVFLFTTAAQAAHPKGPHAATDVSEDDLAATGLCPASADAQEIVTRAANAQERLDGALAVRAALASRLEPAQRELARSADFDANRAEVADQQKNLDAKRAQLAALKPGWFGRTPREQPRLQAQVDEARAAYEAAVQRFADRVDARLPAAAQQSLYEVRTQFFQANVEAEVAGSQLETLKKFGCF
jgi:hypothetical protein